MTILTILYVFKSSQITAIAINIPKTLFLFFAFFKIGLMIRPIIIIIAAAVVKRDFGM